MRSKIEQKPFESQEVENFFAKWCRANDSIEPLVLSRRLWETLGADGILQKKKWGGYVLYIPEDLQLWEMVKIIRAVDRDTFKDKPKRQGESEEKILELGNTFKNAGVYIAQRLDSIKQGQQIARRMAVDFYNYGQSLVLAEQRGNCENIHEIASHVLTDTELETIDKFLAGDVLYASRKARAEKASAAEPDKRDSFYEEERRKTLAQFFAASEKAFSLLGRQRKSGKVADSEMALQDESAKSKAWYEYQKFLGKIPLSPEEQVEKESLEKIIFTLRPWKNTALSHTAFIEKIEKAISKKVEFPKKELGTTILKRGMEYLQKNMPFYTLPDIIKMYILHWQNGETSLREALEIDKLKAELQEVRETGNITEIAMHELYIAHKVQSAIQHFSYMSGVSSPSEIVATQRINCVGASLLGGTLMGEAGLSYLVGQLPGHSILFLITSDGQIGWWDMLNSSDNLQLKGDAISGKKKDGSPITIADLIGLTKKPLDEGLTFEIKRDQDEWRRLQHWFKPWQKQTVTVSTPENGIQEQILGNLGLVFYRNGFYKEASESCRQAIVANPNIVYNYDLLGCTLVELGKSGEAIEAYQQVITINPEDVYAYNNLGIALGKLGRHEESIEAYRQAIAVDPERPYPHYNLGSALYRIGSYEGAPAPFQRFIELADTKKDGRLIKEAKERLKDLRIKGYI